MARPKNSHEDCPYEAALQALKCIGGRWKVLIIRRLLVDGPCGFNTLQRSLDGVSAKMLAQQLKELEVDGILRRREIVATPPKTVVYSLTALGEELRLVIDALTHWGRAWLADRNGQEVPFATAK
ncbi:MAG: helix-turn-helix domain-containing protein [Devosia sp.]